MKNIKSDDVNVSLHRWLKETGIEGELPYQNEKCVIFQYNQGRCGGGAPPALKLCCFAGQKWHCNVSLQGNILDQRPFDKLLLLKKGYRKSNIANSLIIELI